MIQIMPGRGPPSVGGMSGGGQGSQALSDHGQGYQGALGTPTAMSGQMMANFNGSDMGSNSSMPHQSQQRQHMGGKAGQMGGSKGNRRHNSANFQSNMSQISSDSRSQMGDQRSHMGDNRSQ